VALSQWLSVRGLVFLIYLFRAGEEPEVSFAFAIGATFAALVGLISEYCGRG